MKIPKNITNLLTQASNSIHKLFKIMSCANLNKCDYCDLQRTIHPTTKQQIEKLDKWFADIDYLYKAKLIPNNTAVQISRCL